MMINIIVSFENRIKYHEGFILRTLLGLKIVYGANLNLIVLTDKNDYVNIIYNNRFRRIKSLAIKMVNKANISRHNTSNYIAIFSSEDHPDYSYFKRLGIKPKILRSLYEEELEDSLIYDKFSFPDLSEIEELINAREIRRSFITR
jgi:hypothetical protein